MRNIVGEREGLKFWPIKLNQSSEKASFFSFDPPVRSSLLFLSPSFFLLFPHSLPTSITDKSNSSEELGRGKREREGLLLPPSLLVRWLPSMHVDEFFSTPPFSTFLSEIRLRSRKKGKQSLQEYSMHNRLLCQGLPPPFFAKKLRFPVTERRRRRRPF